MVDPLGLATNLVSGIMSRVTEVKTNREECKLLASLAEKMLPLLETLHARDLTDPSVTGAIELVHDALKEAEKVVEDCYKAAFFSALLRPESYSVPLRHAAEKLDHAVSQIPLVSISMVAEIQSDMATLFEQLRHVKLNDKASIADQTKALKEELGKAFHQNVQESDEVKKLIRELMQEHSSSNDELRIELAKLQVNVSEARLVKEKQQEFELNHVIAVLSESLEEGSGERRLAQDLKDHLCCPISKEIMRDPVLLKESGMIYDRSSIEEWLRRGHHHDPLTNIEPISGDYFPCRALQGACQRLLEESEASSLVADNPPIEESEPHMIVPGLYEGHGKLMIGSRIIHASQVLVLQPSGLALGCCLYKRENSVSRKNEVEIGYGEWGKNSSLQLLFENDCYFYKGEVDLEISGRNLGMKWIGKVSAIDALDVKHDFVFVCSTPYVSRSIWARPGIWQMESDILSTENNVKYNSKLVLALEGDSTIQGCMWFESVSVEPKTIGRIEGGSWDTDGSITFKVEFSLSDKQQSLKINRRDYFASYKVTGSLIPDGKERLPTFITVVVKVMSSSASPNDRSTYIPLEDQDRLEYSYIREATTSWYGFVPGPQRIFQISDDYELEAGEYCIRADLEGGDDSMSYYMHAWLWYTDFIPQPYTHVSWAAGYANDGCDPQLFADVWRMDKTFHSNKYKISIRATHRNSRNIKDHVGKSLTIWRSGDASKNHGDCYLCVKKTSRIEEQLVWSLKKRHGGLHLVLEGAHNSSIGGSAQYFVSNPVFQRDRRDVHTLYAPLTQDVKQALKITIERAQY